MFIIQELESRFEMEVITMSDGSVWDTSAGSVSEAAHASCCENYSCSVIVQPPK